MTIIYGLIRVLATTLFLYLSWRWLREDYKQEDLLSYGWLFLLAFLVGGRITFGLLNWGVWNDSWLDWLSVWSKPGFDYLGGYAGGLLLSWIFVNNKGWKIWNFAEDIMPVMLIYFLFLMIGETVFARFSMDTLLWLAAVVLVLVSSMVIKDKYRSMIWYVSGRKGFVFFFANMVFGLTGLGVATGLGQPMVLRIAMGVWGLISAVGLVILGDIVSSLKIKKK